MIPRRWNWRHLGALLVVLLVATGVGAQGFAPTSSVSGGSSSSTSIVHQAAVTLTDAQIKALPTTTPELVAPVAGKVIIVLHTAVAFRWFADYANIDVASQFIYQYASGAYIQNVIPNGSLAVLLASGEDQAWTRGFADINNGPTVDWRANAVVLAVDNNGAGPFIGGHVDNTLSIAVAYLILNLTTGVFE